MPLDYMDQKLQHISGFTHQAKGRDDEAITVQVSGEALTDFGELHCLRKASDKYDAGQYTNQVVVVRTTDFENDPAPNWTASIDIVVPTSPASSDDV